MHVWWCQPAVAALFDPVCATAGSRLVPVPETQAVAEPLLGPTGAPAALFCPCPCFAALSYRYPILSFVLQLPPPWSHQPPRPEDPA